MQSILSPLHFDYIHASPVCSTYSVLAGGKHRNKFNYNRTPESHKADAMLVSLYRFVKGALKRDDSIREPPVNLEEWLRPTHLFQANFPNSGNRGHLGNGITNETNLAGNARTINSFHNNLIRSSRDLRQGQQNEARPYQYLFPLSSYPSCAHYQCSSPTASSLIAVSGVSSGLN